MTGNGGFDGTKQWGESFIKLHYSPPAQGQAASLKVVDHWTPCTIKHVRELLRHLLTS